MRKMLGWVAALLACCAASMAFAEETLDARILTAQRAMVEALELRDAGKYAEAIAKSESALVLFDAALGEMNFASAICLSVLGELHGDQGNSTKAALLLERALAINEAVGGKNHPFVADSLMRLASLYRSQNFYEQATSLYERALTIREAALGPNHLEVAATLGGLATLYQDLGRSDRAEPLLQRALTIREAALGPNHPEVAATLHKLAVLLQDQGLYGQAEPLYERALAIKKTALGEDHAEVALTLNSLGTLYLAQGGYDRAEPLHKRALAIWEATQGKNHPNVAVALNNLATIYLRQESYDRAEPLFQRALAIREATLGRSHPVVAAALNNLGSFYLHQGSYDRAESLLQRALAIQEGVLGKTHPHLASPLNNLAEVYQAQGLYDRAEPLLQRALALMEESLGKSHPDIATSIRNLAVLRLRQNRLAEAIPLLGRALALSEGRLRKEALGFSESRLASFLQHLRTQEETLYTLLSNHPENSRVRRLVLGATLLLKGRSVEETASVSRTIYRSLGAKDREAFERLRELRTQLATLSFQKPGSRSPNDYQERLQALAAQGDALEAALAKRSVPLRALVAQPTADDMVERVAQALPKEGALVEFIAYEGTPGHLRLGQYRYQVLVLFPNATTRAVDLGPAAPIDAAVSRLRNALANRDASFEASAQALYALVFRPLLPLLGDTRRVFLSPDGQLGLIPFAAIHDGRQFLVDSFDFTYLTSGRDLLPRPRDTAPSRSVVVMADPDFLGSPLAAVTPPQGAAEPAERSSTLDRSFAELRAELGGRSWGPLPGTREEAKAIQRLIPRAQLFLGAQATKERLLRLPPPGVLHLATHGFFLEDAPASQTSRAMGSFGALGEETPGPRLPEPLLRSGLVLAGARASQQGTSQGTQGASLDSALVTALELAGLNLWGTELVVLSACDTGRGEVKLRQGVYGLRRALVVAGAETVVMSLWKVNDETTRTLMENYYRHLLHGLGRAKAMREAMRSLRAAWPHPHYWAPFITLGQDAPLRSLAPSSRRPTSSATP